MKIDFCFFETAKQSGDTLVLEKVRFRQQMHPSMDTNVTYSQVVVHMGARVLHVWDKGSFSFMVPFDITLTRENVNLKEVGFDYNVLDEGY